MKSQAFYSHGTVEGQLAFLDSCDYAPIYRQAAKDWYQNNRIWRPVTEEECDYALNAVPPIAIRRGFIAGEPYCHTLQGKPVYNCFRYFNGVPHTMLATVEEHLHSNFPVQTQRHETYASNQSTEEDYSTKTSY